MNDETDLKKWAKKKIQEQTDSLTTTVLNGKNPNKIFHTTNVGHYSIDATVRSNTINLQQDMELIVGDEKYTYDEIKTMLSILKQIAKEKRPEEFI